MRGCRVDSAGALFRCDVVGEDAENGAIEERDAGMWRARGAYAPDEGRDFGLRRLAQKGYSRALETGI